MPASSLLAVWTRAMAKRSVTRLAPRELVLVGSSSLGGGDPSITSPLVTGSQVKLPVFLEGVGVAGTAAGRGSVAGRSIQDRALDTSQPLRLLQGKRRL